jgi:hypothetical protein
MRAHPISYFLWCFPPVVMIVVTAYMLRGRLHREHPAFFNFLVFQIAAFAVELPLRNWDNYFYVYWVITGLSVLFSFAVLVELVQKVVDGIETLQHWNIPLFCWCALAVVAVAAMWPLASSVVDNITNEIFVLNRTVWVTQFALAFLMVMFGSSVLISKRSLIFGIAVGFGFSAIVNLCVMVLPLNRTFLSRETLSGASGAAYLICTLIWLAYAAAATKDTDLLRLS